MPSKYGQDLTLLDAQLDELEKIAISQAGAGRLIGALGGALAGGAAGYSTAPEGQRLSRALGWGTLGALGGLGVGQAATGQGQRQIGRFAKRQLHGMTGYLPGRGILGRGKKGTKWYRVGQAPKRGVTKKQRLEGLKEMKWGGLEPAESTTGQVVGKLGKPGKKVQKFLQGRANKAQQAAREQAELGETSLPGVVKGYLTHPLQTASRAVRAPGLALGVGVPAAFIAPSAVESVQTRDVRPVLRSAAETAGYAATGGLPLLPAMAAGTAFSSAAGRVLGNPPPPPQMQLAPNRGQVR